MVNNKEKLFSQCASPYPCYIYGSGHIKCWMAI